jgi:hypothetical protein
VVAAELTSARTLTPLDQRPVVSYVDSCQTPDGGYFFARVPPASAQDTYHVIKCLALLGQRPLGLRALKGWLSAAADSGVARNLRGLYFLSEAYSDLQMSTEPLLEGVNSVWALQNPCGGFGTVDRVYVEVPSELEATYCATATLQNLGATVDAPRVAAFVERFRNADGGFGGEGRSTLASTHYALATLARLGHSSEHAQETLAWLRQREECWDIQYLEDLFWLVQALEALGEGVRHREKAAAFTLGCQRPSGGFGRAHWGIATLEDTHHAVAVLKSAGYLGDEGLG